MTCWQNIADKGVTFDFADRNGVVFGKGRGRLRSHWRVVHGQSLAHEASLRLVDFSVKVVCHRMVGRGCGKLRFKNGVQRGGGQGANSRFLTAASRPFGMTIREQELRYGSE